MNTTAKCLQTHLFVILFIFCISSPFQLLRVNTNEILLALLCFQQEDPKDFLLKIDRRRFLMYHKRKIRA